MIVVIIFEQDVDPLKEDVAHMVIDKVPLIKDHVNADIIGGTITYLRSYERNLVALNVQAD